MLAQTAFKREMSCFCGAICYRIPLRTQAKMAPRWEADGVFLGKLDLSDEVIVGTSKGIETTRSFRRVRADPQWSPETLRMFIGVPWHPRGLMTDSLGGFANVTSRDLWCKSMARQTFPQPAREIHKSMCKGVENGLRRSSIERNSRGQPRAVVHQEVLGRVAEEAIPADQLAVIQEPIAIPPQPTSSSAEDPCENPRR